MLTEKPPANPASARSCLAFATSFLNGLLFSAPGNASGRKAWQTLHVPGVMLSAIAS